MKVKAKYLGEGTQPESSEGRLSLLFVFWLTPGAVATGALRLDRKEISVSAQKAMPLQHVGLNPAIDRVTGTVGPGRRKLSDMARSGDNGVWTVITKGCEKAENARVRAGWLHHVSNVCSWSVKCKHTGESVS